MSILKNKLRIGSFSSSQIHHLMTLSRDKKDFGSTGKKYIKQKKYERKLGRIISVENVARPLQYGTCSELIAFEKLSTQYTMRSDETTQHPLYNFWCGSADVIKNTNEGIVVGEVKCPHTLESFCDFIDNFEEGGIQAVRDNHPDGEAYYFQLVSNCAIMGTNLAELILFMPYESELQEIKDNAQLYGFAWITFASDLELPYLIDGGHYKNINVLPFEIPQSDIDALTANVIKANDLCGYEDLLIDIQNT